MQKPLFDLKNLMVAQTTEIELRHPVSKVGLGMFITIVGKDSDPFQAAQRARMNTRLHEAKKSGANTPSAEQIDEENLTLLCKCVINWRTLILGGEEFPYTPENVRKLLTEYPWVREQIDEEVGDRGNFIKS